MQQEAPYYERLHLILIGKARSGSQGWQTDVCLLGRAALSYTTQPPGSLEPVLCVMLPPRTEKAVQTGRVGRALSALSHTRCSTDFVSES